MCSRIKVENTHEINTIAFDQDYIIKPSIMYSCFDLYTHVHQHKITNTYSKLNSSSIELCLTEEYLNTHTHTPHRYYICTCVKHLTTYMHTHTHTSLE